MSLDAIAAFRLTSADPQRLSRFYLGLGFEIVASESIPRAELALLGLSGRGERLRLRLGAHCVDLDRFDPPGAPYPADASSADLCFQHLALVTDDARAAWARAAAAGAVPISDRGPVTLPASAGGVTAMKFRDPEGHPLEFLQFPAHGASLWRGAGVLGIDHSAISVSDLEASRRFYAALGLAAGRGSRNHGPTQAALDGLAAPVVDVVPMLPQQPTPHLELLAYRTPRGAPAGRLAANDVAATRIVWQADRDALLRDPDGHLHWLTTRPRATPIVALGNQEAH